jgi:pentatricopeptide repeat protein
MHLISICTFHLSSEPPSSSSSIPQQDLKPDHGTNFLPGSEEAPDHMAPQPLDHFKRGYKERSHLRDRETNQLTNDFESTAQEARPGPPPPNSTSTYSGKPSYADAQQQQPPHHGHESNKPMQRRHTDNDFRGRGATSFDAIRLVDNLCRPGCNLVEALDEANASFSASFQSGKAVTAILSNLARRRKIGVALSVWQWMDQRKIEKNVFHYNSFISVCEKMKDNQRALRLLAEMEQRGIQKNEVT